MKIWHLVILALALGILAYIAYIMFGQQGKKTVTTTKTSVTTTQQPEQAKTTTTVPDQNIQKPTTTPLPTPQYVTTPSEWKPYMGSPYGRTMTAPTVTQSQVAGYATSVTISPYNIPTLKGVLAK